ncbi:meiotically up-regulated gene 14 protein [Rhypophila decipiens]
MSPPSATSPSSTTNQVTTVLSQIKDSNNNKNEASKTKKQTPLQQISQGTVTLSGPPSHPTFARERQHRLNHMAASFRHWSRENYVFGFSGHISVRDPEYPSTFWTNPLGVHFGLLKASDMILVNLRGQIVGGNRSRPANTAGFLIHGAIHEARPDVHAACHAHSRYGRAFSALGKRLDMISQDVCKFMGEAHAVYETYGGVVLVEEEGKNIARALGPKGKGVILKNHGLLTVGGTVDEAAWLFDVMEGACRDQLLVDAAVGRGGDEREGKMVIGEEEARMNFELEGDADYCYAEFQVYYQFEMAMARRKGLEFDDAEEMEVEIEVIE